VKRYQQRLAKLAAEEATPNGPYGPDFAGDRLGMSFEDAEAAIRSHMKVGRVLEGRRAFAATEKNGFVKPLDSGKLFISESGDELIAILVYAPKLVDYTEGMELEVLPEDCAFLRERGFAVDPNRTSLPHGSGPTYGREQ
jgi:hypothetical protein